MRSLRRQLAISTIVATLGALFVFALVVWLAIYFDERDAAEASNQALPALAIAAPVGIAMAIGAATWSSRRAMRAIDSAVKTAAEISVDRFDRRMDMPEGELQPLAMAINQLLDRLQRGYDALAAFSADASHELRTPLAAVCSELEVGLRRPRTADEWSASATTALAELRRLANIVDSMLRFAQADAARISDADIVELGEVVDDIAAVHPKVEVGDIEGRVRGDAALLATALGNLVANASRLALHVRISVEETHDALAIHVDDDGPGLPAERAQLFAPFARFGPSAGVGLGLAIARRIAVRHGGDIACADGALGGARFTLQLPRIAS